MYTVAGGSESKEGMKIGRRLRELYIGHRRTKKKGRRHIYIWRRLFCSRYTGWSRPGPQCGKLVAWSLPLLPGRVPSLSPLVVRCLVGLASIWVRKLHGLISEKFRDEPKTVTFNQRQKYAVCIGKIVLVPHDVLLVKVLIYKSECFP